MKSLKEQYKNGEAGREPYLTRAKRYSRMTIPAIVPDGDRSGEALTGTFSSVGVEELNHLSNKVANEIFPIGKSFFTLEIDEELDKELEGEEEKANIVRTLYSQVTRRANKYLTGMRLRSSIVLSEKHLIISGNVALVLKEEGIKTLGLGSFIVKRDLQGNVIYAITEEVANLCDLPEGVRDKYRADKRSIVSSSSSPSSETEEQEVSIYTGYFRKEGGKYTVWQELDEVRIMKDVHYGKNELPLLLPRWHAISGEDYGRGYIEDYKDHFGFLQILETARALGAVTMLQVYYLKRLGSSLDITALNNARNGSWHLGEEKDVTVLQVNKYTDGTLITSVISDLRAILGRAFLMTSSSVRDSERTTAYEIQTLTNDLNTPMSEIYATQEVDIQLPLAYLAIHKVAPELFRTGVTPLIMTGIEALGKSQDLAKLSKYSEMMLLPSSWPEELQRKIDWSTYSSYLENILGLQITFFKSKEEVKEQQDSASNGVADNSFAESMATSAGNEIGKRMGGQSA